MSRQETVARPPRTGAPPQLRFGTAAAVLAAPAAGAAVGFAALGLAATGARERPVLAGALLVAGAVSALVPFRYGLPVAIVLSAFEGFMIDFAADWALYWNELFVAGILARSLAARRPSRRDLLAVAAIVAVYGLYVAAGTDPSAAFWGAKVLLTSVAVFWALARLELGRREWEFTYYGLAAAAAAGLVLGVWQRSLGVRGLADLGVEYGERLREVAGGGLLRAYGGFTSPAAFSYMLAITLCAWGAFALGGSRERRVALITGWVPPVAVTGIVLSVDRTAGIGFLAALVVVAVTFKRNVLLPAAAATVVVFAAAVAVVGTSHFGGELRSAAKARTTLWLQYLGDLSPFGEGPASAGSAYDKVAPDGWVTPLRVPQNWRVDYEGIRIGSPSLAVVETRRAVRGPLRLQADATALGVRRRLRVILGYDVTRGTTLLERPVPAGRAVPIRMKVPRRRGRETPLWFTAEPEPIVRRTKYLGELVNLVTNPSFEKGTGGWYGVVSRDTRQARLASASLEVTDAEGFEVGNQGARYGPFALERGKTYTVSSYLRGAVGGESVAFALVGSRRWHSGNGVANGDFETDVDGWAFIYRTEGMSRTTRVKRLGTAAARVDLPADAGDHGAYVGVPRYAAGTRFGASGWVRGIAARGYYIRVTNAIGYERGIHHFTATGRWQPVSVSATAQPGDTGFWVAFRREDRRGREAFYLDGVMTEPIPYRAVRRSDPMRLSRSWRRYEYTFTAATTDPEARLYIRTPEGVTDRQTYFVDGVQIEEGRTATSYCDGSVANCRWAEAPHASPSYRGGATTLVRAVETAPPAGTRETIRIRSAWLPMPQKPPFVVTVGSEEMRVTAIPDLTTYRVRRGVNGTTTTRHAAGAAVTAVIKRAARDGPRRADGVLASLRSDPFARRSTRRVVAEDAETPETPVVEVKDLRLAGIPEARTPAERIWNRWLEETPAALEGDGPGLVDNLYVLWIYQYGLLGLALCGVWFGVLLWPTFVRPKGPATIAAAGTGVFLIVAALAVSVWEEAPTDFVAAVIFAHAFAEVRGHRQSRPRRGHVPLGREPGAGSV